jgi:hypothetical protein
LLKIIHYGIIALYNHDMIRNMENENENKWTNPTDT